MYYFFTSLGTRQVTILITKAKSIYLFSKIQINVWICGTYYIRQKQCPYRTMIFLSNVQARPIKIIKEIDKEIYGKFT